MTPAKYTDSATRNADLLTDAWRGKPIVRAILIALLRPFQDLEDAAWSLLYGRVLDNAIGDALDKLGSKVGEARLGRGDESYRLAIRIVALVLKSRGTPDDLIRIVLAALPVIYRYDEAARGIRIEALGVDVVALARYLARARPAGYGLELISSDPSSAPALALRYASRAGVVAGSGTWGSTRTPSPSPAVYAHARRI